MRIKKLDSLRQAQWHTSVTPAFWEMRKDGHEFKASLDIGSPELKSGHKQYMRNKCCGRQPQLFTGMRDQQMLELC